MKLLFLSSLNGNIDLINEYADKSGCDAVLTTGDFGIFYQFDETKHLPSFLHKSRGNFHEYMGRRKQFNIPVFTVYGSHENHSLVKRIVQKDISIPNFNIVSNGEVVDLQGIKIGGIGGTFSPVAYNQEKLSGYKKRHFLKKEIEKLKKQTCDILLMHDLLGECSAKKVVFTDETYNLFYDTCPYYCFVGKYNWLGHQKIPLVKPGVSDLSFMVVLMLERAKDSYVLLDTDTWDAEAISLKFSLNHTNKGDKSESKICT